MKNTIKTLELVYKFMDSEAAMHTLDVFITVADAHRRNEDIELRDVQKATGLSNSAAHRNLQMLSEIYRAGRPGYGLIEARVDVHDRRRRYWHLTRKGEQFAKELP